MTKAQMDRLSERLDSLGMRLQGERLLRAAAIVQAHGRDQMDIADMVLLSICVEAYRQADRDMLQIV